MIKNEEIFVCEYYVNGMHCSACEIFIENELIKHEDISKIKANLNNNSVYIESKNPLNLEKLNELIKEFGYNISAEKQIQSKPNSKDLIYSLFIAILFLTGFIFLQKFGIINLLNTNQITYPFIFLIGIVASVSSCMAVVGGLVLSISTNYAKSKKDFWPIVMFHWSRLISFFILGGWLGLVGNAFTITPLLSFLISIVLFVVMIIMGLNLLEVFSISKKMQLTIPKLFFNKLINRNIPEKYAPIFLGFITFFLPCGFTQSMQIYALSTGNFMNGALTMLTFAIGTLPVLAIISFLSYKISEKLKSGIFFKTAGFIIIFFAILNFIGALTSAGIINPILNF